MALALPTMASAMGIDGGAIFQIIAVEDLALGPTAIGIGLSLSVLSVPFQVWAARIPLARAVTDLQLFFVSVTVHCALLAALVALAAPSGFWAHSALALAVTAEIALSVLWATSWQPLLTYTVGAAARQRINSLGRAAGNALMVAALVAFGFAASWARTAFLVVVAAVAAGLGIVVHGLPGTTTTGDTPSGTTIHTPTIDDTPSGTTTHTRTTGDTPSGTTTDLPNPDDTHTGTGDSPTIGEPSGSPVAPMSVLVAAGVVAVAAWPLFVTYTGRVLWPSVNLGLVAGAQFAGAVLAAVGWRPTADALVARARLGALVALVAATGLAIVRAPVDGRGAGLAVLALAAVSAAATTTVALALLELTHQALTGETAVRRLTIFDVVASTSAQIGFFVAGLLTSASVGSTWPVDAYRLYLLATAGVLLVVLARIPSDARVAAGEV